MFEWTDGSNHYVVDKTKVTFYQVQDGVVLLYFGKDFCLRTPLSLDEVKAELQSHSQA